MSGRPMKTIDEIRRENARALADAAGGNAAFSAKIDREPTQASRFIGKNHTKNIGDSLARHIEECFNLPIGWLDQNRDQSSDNEVTLISEFRKVPLRTFREIENGEKHQHTTVCPFECSSSTYAFAVEGSANGPSAMHPSYGRAYPVGSIVFVDPEQTENLQHNDIVAAILTDENAFTFRLLLKEAGRDILMPLNPQFPPIGHDRPFKIVGKIIGAILP